MIWQRPNWRRIYMTDKHSEHVKPSWFGESIGRYENGEVRRRHRRPVREQRASHIDMFRTLTLANFERAHRLRGMRNIGSFSTIS